ncbi:MAG: prepilin-type N-terminal cleavage/methylation domain-containing protein [Candidatus Riflebacteria bacterium]|nr:prepilin-type N-terminal cleavage/methylation domain-containing protein [Candidatus Riflebacteria bacterium]
MTVQVVPLRNKKNIFTKKAFTLIEISIVLAIIGILYVTVVPMYGETVLRAKEAALKEDLYVMRKLLDQYYKDRQKWPSNLSELVNQGYLRNIPPDPFTGKNETWKTKPSEDGLSDVYDVFSGAQGAGKDGKAYSSW